jgi:hypothetical protein
MCVRLFLLLCYTEKGPQNQVAAGIESPCGRERPHWLWQGLTAAAAAYHAGTAAVTCHWILYFVVAAVRWGMLPLPLAVVAAAGCCRCRRLLSIYQLLSLLSGVVTAVSYVICYRCCLPAGLVALAGRKMRPWHGADATPATAEHWDQRRPHVQFFCFFEAVQ